jgi:hypothetical protein
MRFVNEAEEIFSQDPYFDDAQSSLGSRTRMKRGATKAMKAHQSQQDKFGPRLQCF